MNPVTFSPCIDIATISVMQRSMNRVLMTRAIRLRSRMRGKLSCPVLEAGRREQSLLPSYHIRYIDMHRLKGEENTERRPAIRVAVGSPGLAAHERLFFSASRTTA